MKIVHTYINNMYINPEDESKECFAHKWGLVSLAELGHNVTLLCGGEGKKRKEYFWNKIRVFELPPLIGANNTSRILKGFIKELKKIDADIFHTHHYSSLIPELTLAVGKSRGIPTFLTVHNTFVEDNFLRKILGLLYLFLMQPFLFFYTKIFFISNYIKQKKAFYLVNKHNKIVIYNHIKHPPEINTKRKKESICYLGRLTHQKGADFLIKAVSELKKEFPQIKLFLAGKGEKKYLAYLKHLVKKLNLKDNVSFLKVKKGKEKWIYFYQASVLVVPSRDEGFGNIPIEAMLCRTPLIISNKGALREATGGNAEIFSIKNKKDLSKKIKNALLNPNKEKIERAYNFALRYTKDNIGQVFSYYYSKALQK